MLLCSRLLLGQFQVIRREQEEQLTGKCSLLSLKVLVGRYLQQFKHRQIRLMISQCNILMCFLTDCAHQLSHQIGEFVREHSSDLINSHLMTPSCLRLCLRFKQRPHLFLMNVTFSFPVLSSLIRYWTVCLCIVQIENVLWLDCISVIKLRWLQVRFTWNCWRENWKNLALLRNWCHISWAAQGVRGELTLMLHLNSSRKKEILCNGKHSCPTGRHLDELLYSSDTQSVSVAVCRTHSFAWTHTVNTSIQ